METRIVVLTQERFIPSNYQGGTIVLRRGLRPGKAFYVLQDARGTFGGRDVVTLEEVSGLVEATTKIVVDRARIRYLLGTFHRERFWGSWRSVVDAVPYMLGELDEKDTELAALQETLGDVQRQLADANTILTQGGGWAVELEEVAQHLEDEARVLRLQLEDTRAGLQSETVRADAQHEWGSAQYRRANGLVADLENVLRQNTEDERPALATVDTLLGTIAGLKGDLERSKDSDTAKDVRIKALLATIEKVKGVDWAFNRNRVIQDCANVALRWNGYRHPGAYDEILQLQETDATHVAIGFCAATRIDTLERCAILVEDAGDVMENSGDVSCGYFADATAAKIRKLKEEE